jgi:hypothetical protein
VFSGISDADFIEIYSEIYQCHPLLIVQHLNLVMEGKIKIEIKELNSKKMEIPGYYRANNHFVQFETPVFPYVVWKPEVEVRVFEEWFSEMES